MNFIFFGYFSQGCQRHSEFMLKLGRGRVPMRVGQCYAIAGAGAEGQRSGSVVGTGRTRLQLICCTLATEPRCPIILREDGTEGEQRGQIVIKCLSRLQVKVLVTNRSGLYMRGRM